MKLFLEYEIAKNNLRSLKTHQIELLGRILKEKKPKQKEKLMFVLGVSERSIQEAEKHRNEIKQELKNSFQHGRDPLDWIYWAYYIENRSVTNIAALSNYSERSVYRKLDEINKMIEEAEK